jgi:hypothetical protein
MALAIASVSSAQTVDQLEPHNVKMEQVEYKGKRAIKIVQEGLAPNGENYAIIKGTTFNNGEIEVELAGQPGGGNNAGSPGFIGIAFRIRDGQFEYISLRPANGRADDQVRRNHSTQYSAHPKFTFSVTRALEPEKYESYVDLEPGVWMRYRITVECTKARFVHGATQRCLIVNDLKARRRLLGRPSALDRPGRDGYFSGLQIRDAE